jgi:DNA-binding transcriptional ArsR family regulator
VTESKESVTELHIGRADQVHVRVMFDPYISMLALAVGALGRQGRGIPDPWRYRILGATPPDGARALQPLVEPGYSVAPDFVMSAYPLVETRIEDQLERLRDTSAEEVRSDLAGTFGDRIPPHWRDICKSPHRWLRGYTSAISATWSAIQPFWRRARPLFDREAERVGTAVVRGQLDIILGTIHKRSRLDGDVLKIHDPEPASFKLAGRPLILTPILCGDISICSFDRPDAVWVGYPLPGIGRLFTEKSKPIHDSPLDLLLGPVRAQILTALIRPFTMGELATRTKLAPSAVTYHCERLTALGLVERQRHGREVRVFRTHRFDHLAQLFDVGPLKAADRPDRARGLAVRSSRR